MILTISGFLGEMPRIAPHLLPNSAAQVAANANLSSGDLKSQLGLSAQIKAAGGLTNPRGAFFTDDGNHLVWSSSERTLVKSQVINDFYRRVYMVDNMYIGTIDESRLRVLQQFAVTAQAGVWDPTVTYALGWKATYPGTVPANWDIAATYKKGAIACYPAASTIYPDHNRIYRSLADGNLGNNPFTQSAWWEPYGGVGGILYNSLQSGNLSHTPGSSPEWWEPAGYSAQGDPFYAGVPAPKAWPTKTGETYNVNVIPGDPQGKLDPYHVPKETADMRAARDAEGIETSALIAVARSTLLDNIIIRKSPTDAEDTAAVYYDSEGVKVQENLVQMEEIERGRLYGFDQPPPQQSLTEFVVTQIWCDPADIDTTPIVTPGGDGGGGGGDGGG